MGHIERLCREVVKKGFNKKIGQAVVIQHMVSSNKHSAWPHFICHQYLSLPSTSPSLFPISSFSLFHFPSMNVPSSVCFTLRSSNPPPPHHPSRFEPSCFHPYWLQWPDFMQFLDSSLISANAKVCFLVFALLCQVCVVLCIAYLVFLIIPLDKVLNQIILLK